jgi:serine/threonine protein kinase
MAASPLLCNNCGTQNPPSESFCGSCGYTLAGATIVATAIATATGQLPTQTLLKQRYRVLRTAGKGGMGAVYMAQDTQLGDRLVAVKEMSQGNVYGQQAQDAIESFKSEAHLLAGLQHPNLPGIHDYFEEAGRWYLVMSFIEGDTLAQYLAHAQGQKLTLEETLRIGLALCNVLNYLHTQKPPIIFRDLKPSNIMRNADGHIYLIDFGIARHFKPGQAKDTANYGSMGYSPLEQYGRAQTTERSDIYSLGVTLYECLSGYDPTQSPFRFPPLQTLVSKLPPRLVTLITQMLEMDESKRPANINVVEQELQQVSASKSAPRRRVSKPVAPKPQVQAPVPTPLISTQYPTPVTPIPSAPTPVTPIPPIPTPLTPTQYATPATPIPSAPTQQATPVAPIPSPIPVSYTPMPVNQIYTQPAAIANITSIPSQPPLLKKTLTVGRKVLSIIGMIIGGFFALVGFLGTLINSGDPTQTFGNLAIGGLILFFGVLIFFIARIRKSFLPIPKAKKIEAAIGKGIGIFASIFAIGTIIAAIMNPRQDYGDHADISTIIVSNVFTIIFGALIWWVTRIKIKKTP